MSLKDCIASALDRGAISADEAKFLLGRAEAYRELSGGEAKAAFAADLDAEAKEKARVAGLQADATARIYDDLRRHARLSGKADIVKAAYALFENFGSGYASFRSTRNALLSQALSEMNDFMHAFRRNFAMRRVGKPMLDDVVRGLFGENVGDAAKALGESWSRVAEKLRGQFNAAGGHVGRLEDWAVPQRHDPAALLASGFDAWRDFIKDRLDWDRIRRPITGLAVPEGERDAMLRQVYNAIVTDGWNRREPSSTPYGRGALYNQRDDARFLHFKDADAWLDYSRAYGRGSPFAALIDHVNGLTRDVALMKRFGPNPAATIEWLKQAIASEAAKAKLKEPSMFAHENGLTADFALVKSRMMIDGFLDAARGSALPFSRAGAAMAMWRDVQYGAKLGSAAILHTLANPVIQAMGRHLQGHALLQMPLDIIRGFSRGEADEAGLILDDALNHLESGAREQSAWMKAREATRWLPAFTSHWTGLDAVAAASKRSAMMGQMSTYGRLAGRAFADLPGRVRDGLEGFGIDAPTWDRIRAATPYDAGGRPLLRPQDIADRGAAEAYLGLLHGQAEAMVPQSNLHVQAATAFASRAPIGREVVKSMMMFKSGFLATMMLTQWQAVEREIARHGAGAAGAYLGSGAIALTLGGMLALQAKQVAAGKDMLSVDPTTPEGRAAWGHAFLTSGALGIYGDFLQSELSSYGNNFLETLAGPTVTGAADFVHAAVLAGERGWAAARGTKPPPGSEEKDMVKALRNNTPFLTTAWYARAAFNRLIMDQLQYLVDPNAHQAMRAQEQRIRKDTGQGFWWRPGALTPDRPPQVALPGR